MIVFGVTAGVLAAIGQAISYQLGRRAGLRGVGPAKLLINMQVFFLFFGVIWLTARGWPTAWAWGWLVLGLLAFLSAQAGTFTALRFIPGSRLAPLLGLKVAVLALLGWSWGLEAMSAGRWLATGLIIAAFVVLWRSGPLPLAGLLAALWTVASFATADVALMLVLAPVPEPTPWVLLDILAWQYSLGGALLLPLLMRRQWRPERSQAGVIAAYAGCWLLAVWLLFMAFAHAGLLLAVFCQALRGPLSLALGWWLSRWPSGHRTWGGLEAAQAPSVWWRQAIAAGCMVAAIVLDVWWRAAA